MRESQGRTIRRNLVVWVCLFLFAVILAECIRFEPGPATLRAFLIGFLAAATLATFAWMVFVMSGSYGHSMGRLGEEATADSVASFRRRLKGWRIVNGISLAGHGDVDHVLIGPGGVFVIESKWTTSDCELVGGQIRGLMGREPIAQAKDGARTIERMLRYGRDRFDATVQPVVIIWGPGGIHLAGGWTRADGVIVCEGRQVGLWLRQFDQVTLGKAQIRAMAAVLEGQVARQLAPATA